MRTTDMHDVHEGRNVKRIREILGIKQDALAIDLGITQQAVSLLEQKETIDAPVLEKIATSLGVSIEAIRSYNENAVFNIVSNTFHDSSANHLHYQCQFNPLDKIVELYNEKEKLYDQLLKSEKEKVDMLQSMLKDMKGLMNK
ncbi:helix-turn-helix domain-containing protein [Chitinophagaceae bacterium MMS25-I14]